MRLPKLIRVAVCSAFLLGFARVQPAEAIAIQYSVIDLVDMTVGQDLWQYEYSVSGFDFLTDQGFSLYFSPFLYSDLSDAGVEAPASAEWDILTLLPDPGVPANGAFDALALIDHASLAKVFFVTFVWLGAGTPGAQAFDVNQFDATGALTATLASGASVPVGVPEPAALSILGIGLAGVGARLSRRRNASL